MANQLFQLRVKDLMRKHVVTVNAQDTVRDALELRGVP
jgi:predicted transcriptional regulator